MTQRPRVSRETASRAAREAIFTAAPALTTREIDQLALLVGLVCSTPVGVTSIRDPAEATARHVLDALAGLPAVDAAPQGPLADVGSGGGLPGLVLAVVRPERETHLIEATARKGAFIAEAAAELGLEVQVHAERSEVLGRGELRDACACVVARALAPPPVAVELCLPLCRPGGRLVLWSREQPSAELAFAAQELGGAVLPPEPPGVLVIGKLGATPERFPRRPGMAAKRPLSAARSDRPRR
ncbi:MAG TPA: RsmG family class I SAM-dependent methyltransferase [Gaiellales bacterium]|nr:RsmG family class I SAM-dependent methyltransferase [Gaiellales bacterium]